MARHGKEAEPRSRRAWGTTVGLGLAGSPGLGLAKSWRVDCWEHVEPTWNPEVCSVLERPGAQLGSHGVGRGVG